MTAEVAVMNKSAIALAADSKVTVSGVGSAKTYDTVSKVFTLSKIHPVGIMIFGNADFMSYPWETIIKAYRKQKGLDFHGTIEEWGVDFVEFLGKFGKIEKKHQTENAKQIIYAWLQRVNDEAAAKAIERKYAIPSPEFIELLKDRADDQLKLLLEEGVYFTDVQSKKITKALAKDTYAVVASVFGRYKDDDLIRKCVALGLTSLVAIGLSPQMSGIVIAGYGEDEYFPALAEFNTDGYVGDKIKLVQTGKIVIERDNPSCIRAFAQKDMVQRFMNGVDVGFLEVLERTFAMSLSQGSLGVLEKYGNKRKQTAKVREEIIETVAETSDKLSKAIAAYVKRNFWAPIIQMVALLPKDELAHLAESLVALTSLKRRVSSDAETVGGAVDVALISKGDGFVWVKRKHYFPSDLNPTFIRNYLRGITGGDDDHTG